MIYNNNDSDIKVPLTKKQRKSRAKTKAAKQGRKVARKR